MKTVLLNAPWQDKDNPLLWGVRAGSRWPHFQQRPAPGQLPRYIPFPFMLAIAAALLKSEGHNVLLIDAVAEGCSEENLIERIHAFAPDLVFAEVSTPSLKNDIHIINRLQIEIPSAQFVCGGVHPPELVPQLLQENPAFTHWLAGEYETTLLQLVNALDVNKSTDQIPGLMAAGSTTVNPVVSPDLSALPQPLYEQLPMAHYSDPVCGLPAPVAQTWLSRGCPFGCTFCVWPQLIYNGRHYRTRPIAAALDEVETLLQKHGCDSFYFDDDTTNIGEDRMIELANAIKARGLNAYPWSMMARADCMTPRMIDALADAGLYSIKYGVESISPKLINACEKATNLERFHHAIEHTARAGIKMHLTFTFGIPGETEQTIRESLEYCLAVAPESAQFSLCTPFPGTVFYNECKMNGWLTSDDWSHYLGSSHAVINTPWLSANDLESAYANAVQQWQDFCNDRLAIRQKKLLKKLGAICAGFQWSFHGDREFADFIFESGQDRIFEKQVDQIKPGIIPVIVSRHNEEKIYRQLLRNNQLKQKNLVLKLYS